MKRKERNCLFCLAASSSVLRDTPNMGLQKLLLTIPTGQLRKCQFTHYPNIFFNMYPFPFVTCFQSDLLFPLFAVAADATLI